MAWNSLIIYAWVAVIFYIKKMNMELFTPQCFGIPAFFERTKASLVSILLIIHLVEFAAGFFHYC